MHKIDIDVVDMTLDVMKYVIGRITKTHPELGIPISEQELRERIGQTISAEGIGGQKAFELFREVLVKHTVPIDHPRNLAFVPAAPTRAAIMFDLVTSASSIHGAYWMEGAGGIYCENEAMQWLVSLTGLPQGAFGVFTSGGTAANLSALVAARHHWRTLSNERNSKRGLMVCSNHAHASVKAMAQVIDADVLSIDCYGAMSAHQVIEAVNRLSADDQDRIFALVVTAGTTNAGIIDDLRGCGELCANKSWWMHVDGAYGGAALAAPSVRHLFDGIERADSITIDPHKWLFAPYDCGAVLYKDPQKAKAAHTQEGNYLAIFNEPQFTGFNPADYQIQLTRRVRGLPLWFSLAMHGTDRYSQAIEQGIALAGIAVLAIEKRSYLRVTRPSSLSVVLFERIGWTDQQYSAWTYEQLACGFALVAPTKDLVDGVWKTVARFCFINIDTTIEDIESILDTLE